MSAINNNMLLYHGVNPTINKAHKFFFAKQWCSDTCFNVIKTISLECTKMIICNGEKFYASSDFKKIFRVDFPFSCHPENVRYGKWTAVEESSIYSVIKCASSSKNQKQPLTLGLGYSSYACRGSNRIADLLATNDIGIFSDIRSIKNITIYGEVCDRKIIKQIEKIQFIEDSCTTWIDLQYPISPEIQNLFNETEKIVLDCDCGTILKSIVHDDEKETTRIHGDLNILTDDDLMSRFGL